MFAESKLKLLTLKHVERRLLREYLDLPGLSLSLAQAARLVSVDAPSCQLVLNDLVNAHCLAHSEPERTCERLATATWNAGKAS